MKEQMVFGLNINAFDIISLIIALVVTIYVAAAKILLKKARMNIKHCDYAESDWPSCFGLLVSA